MATILELERSGKLFRLDPALEPNEREWRHVDFLPQAQKRLEDELPSWQSEWDIEETPIQQFDALFEVFCSGETLTYGKQFNPLTHIQDGLWELKTGDLRLFGWFYVRDFFICGAIDLANNVKDHDLYAGYAGQVARLRDQLDLNDPKFVPGSDPNDVVSNYSFP